MTRFLRQPLTCFAAQSRPLGIWVQGDAMCVSSLRIHVLKCGLSQYHLT